MTCCLCFFLTFGLLVGPQSPLKKCFPIWKRKITFLYEACNFWISVGMQERAIAEGVRVFFWLIDMPVANIIMTVFAWYDAITMGSKSLCSRITYFMQQLFNDIFVQLLRYWIYQRLLNWKLWKWFMRYFTIFSCLSKIQKSAQIFRQINVA